MMASREMGDDVQHTTQKPDDLEVSTSVLIAVNVANKKYSVCNIGLFGTIKPDIIIVGRLTIIIERTRLLVD